MILTYLNTLKDKGRFTFEAISNLSGVPEATVKNIFSGKTEDPRFETVSSIVIAMGGSLDEMYNPGKSKDELKETSISAIKEMYEHQIETMKETNELHINNIRAHYEQHRDDVKANYEMRLADKREIIETIKKELRSAKIFAWICVSILVSILVLEVMNPTLGWIQF